MTKANLSPRKSGLPHDANLVRSGVTIIVCERNKPFAELRPLVPATAAKPKRMLGQMQGVFTIPADFNTPNPNGDACSKDPMFSAAPPAAA